ncbi:winged helix-turn-helix domain-containing protein [Sinomonas flava]|uniref:HTH HARE-type domain-containing protein n=1 Tax=Sinomonas flava TaxID=496857 RepID=A0ABN3BT38_9MICC
MTSGGAKLTLHQAMRQVLRLAGRPMTARELADAINRKGLYSRADGAPVPTNQIHARAKNYPDLFVKEEGRLSLASPEGSVAASPPASNLPTYPATAVQKTWRGAASPSERKADAPSLRPAAERELLADARFRRVGSIDPLVPNAPGIYAIPVVAAGALPEPFRSYALGRDDRLIYVGQAKTSLRKRLVDQELRARGHGTFFRTMGAVLGYRPPRGSLVGMANQRNYRFLPSDTARIIAWMNTNLEASWIETLDAIHLTEQTLIADLRPLFNLQSNPAALRELKAARDECQAIASAVT